MYFDVKWSHWLANAIPRARRVEFTSARIFFPEERCVAVAFGDDSERAHGRKELGLRLA